MNESVQQQHADFPSEETLAAYIDGRLDGETREKVVEHIAECGECRSQWETVREFAQSDDLASARDARAGRAWGGRGRFGWRGWGNLAAAAVLILVAGIPVRHWVMARRGIPALVAASESLKVRPIAARVSGGFPYKPNVVWRGVADEVTALDEGSKWELYNAVARNEQRAKSLPTAESLHSLGVSYLLVEKFDDSIRTLESAAIKETHRPDVASARTNLSDSSLLNDLAAAYHARSRRTSKARDLSIAAEMAERSWKLEQTPEAAWNRALIREDLNIRDAALAAWKDYLAVETDVSWRREALEHIAQLEKPTQTELWNDISLGLSTLTEAEIINATATFPQQARAHAEAVLIPALIRAAANGEPQLPNSELFVARAIGRGLVRRSSETLVSDVVQSLDEAVQRRDVRRIAALNSAYRDLLKGKELYQAKHASEAVPVLGHAAKAFRDTDAAGLSAVAEMYGIAALFYLADYDECIRKCDAVIATLRPGMYPSVTARLQWIRSLSLLATARPYEALQGYTAAATTFQRCGELDNLAAVENLIGENLEYLGDADAAADHRRTAVRLKAEIGGPVKYEQIFGGAARAAHAAGFDHVARLYAEAAAHAPMFGADPLETSEIHLLLAMIDARLNDSPSAQRHLVEAETFANRITDPSVSAGLWADIDAARASTGPETSTEQRVRSATAALDHARATRNHFRRAGLLLARGRALVEMRQLPAAEADLREAFEEILYQEQRIPSRAQRIRYVASTREVAEALVNILIDRNDRDGALIVVDRTRARELMTGGAEALLDSGVELNARSFSKGLPPSTAIVEYFSLGDRLVTWFVTARGTEMIVVPAGRARVSSLITDYLQRLRAGDAQAAAERVHAVMVAPWWTLIKDETHVVIALDPELPSFPVAGLSDAADRFVIDKLAIAYAPSIAMFLRSSENGVRDRSRQPDLFMAVGSTFDSKLFPDLSPLTRLAAESAEVRAIYQESETLEGSDLTVGGFLDRAGRHEIVHFGGHVVSAGTAASSALLLSPLARGDSGLLYADTVSRRRFDRTRLVVLSACGSLTDLHVEPVETIAYAFLLAGVPAVVSNLWPLDDTVAAAFLPIFHTELAKDGDAAAALRRAQLVSLQSDDPRLSNPRNWASFEVHGYYHNRGSAS